MYADQAGNAVIQQQTVIVDDVTAPSPDIATLPTVTGECSATIAAPPTATDNCEGGITATTTDPLTYSTQGTHTVTWTYDDGNGNTSQQTQTVIVDDVTAPLPDVASLPTITGECSATVSPPTASDNCEGSITATTTDPLSYAAQGTYTVSWTYDDGNGNSSQQTQTIIVDDMTAPVPDLASLPTVTGECSATIAATPTATDNCEGGITATTTDPLTYSTQGIHTVTWTYDDGNGNTSQQTQTVIVDDVTAPLPDVANLLTITGECSATVTPPTATDNCEGEITATTTDPLTYSTQGTHTVTWTYDDGNGNSSQQTQSVVIDDVTPPVFSVCPGPQTVIMETGVCFGAVPNLVALASATDNCGGNVNITQSVSQGTSFGSAHNDQITVTLTADDGNGNTTTCDVVVTVVDNESPVFAFCPADIELCGEQAVSWTLPIVNDNCSSIMGSAFRPGDVFQVGTTTVIYTAVDHAGNQTSCSFDVTIHALPEVVITQSVLPDFCQGLALLTSGVNNEADLLLPLSYSWSAGLGGDLTAIPTENGTYSVDITDARGCSGTASISLNLVPSDISSAYTLIAKTGIKFDNSSLSSGGAGVMDANQEAKFQAGSVVQTFVKAPSINVKSGSSVASQIIGQVGVSLPLFRQNTNPANNDITVMAGQTMTLTGSSYGNILVEDNATLIFDHPEVFIKGLVTKDGVSIEFLQGTELILDGNIELKSNNMFNPTGQKVIVYTEGEFIVSGGSMVTAGVYAQLKITAKKANAANPTQMFGLFISMDEIQSKDNVEWNAHPNCDLNFVPGGNGTQKTALSTKVEYVWNIYPNPASDYATIEMPDLGQDVEVVVYDLHGRRIWNKKVKAGITHVKLDVSGEYFKSVIHYVQIRGHRIQLTKRLQVLK